MALPTHSGYPGAPIMLVLVGFLSFGIARLVLHFRKIRRKIDLQNVGGTIPFGWNYLDIFIVNGYSSYFV